MGRQRSSSWERNRVAGATVVRRHEGVPTRVGRVYEAFNPRTGNPVVLVAPGEPGGWGHLPSWRFSLSADTQGGCYQLELQEAPTARGLPELTLALSRTARALAQVEDRPEAVAALLGHLAQQRRTRARLQRARPFAVAAAMVLLVVAGGWWARHAFSERPETASGAVAVDEDDRSQAHEEAHTQLAQVAAEVPVATAPRQVFVTGLQLDMPRKPFAGQNVAPCEPQEREIVLKDGTRTCWVSVNFGDLCKTKGYEYGGGCYLPSYPPPKTPASARP
jgi:hypothetical protein